MLLSLSNTNKFYILQIVEQSKQSNCVPFGGRLVIHLNNEGVCEWCACYIDIIIKCYFTSILWLFVCTSSHTWLSLPLIIQWRRREFGHWNFTLPFAILSCCVPLWFNRQLNFLMRESALCATPNCSNPVPFRSNHVSTAREVGEARMKCVR